MTDASDATARPDRPTSGSAERPTSGESVEHVVGPGLPLPGDDVDTDQIVPARFLKEVTFDDMGEYVFYDERRDADGQLGDHPFDRPEHADARVLVVGDNFGCGSSREHAPQALLRWGIRGIVGVSFAEIFADNCAALGVPTVTADRETVDELREFVAANPDAPVRIDVRAERVTYGDHAVSVEIDDATRNALLDGQWDTTAMLRANLETVRETAAELPYVDTVSDPAGSGGS
ncbi:3-isopropylmalate dehydratase small subunit [Halobaculum sp. MBLA0147]|uniref:3-isopropylmalate dehydratase small subunit n=1 Tax=Halobaculum sp. MBLA0147 TaxID=3079934 RepID=UPI003524F996